jgi:hypothetical protein
LAKRSVESVLFAHGWLSHPDGTLKVDFTNGLT